MPALTNFDVQSLSAEFGRWKVPASHAARLLRRFYQASGIIDYAALPISIFGKTLVGLLKEQIAPRQSRVLAEHESGDGTLKLLIGFDRGGAVEAVLMPAYRQDRAAACVSSQIGCAMGCGFCASTRGGLERNLESGEIVEQFLHLRQRAGQKDRRLTSLVFMGMGEPMQNLDHVLAAIPRIAHHAMGALGWRQITVSTVGIVPGIERLAAADLNVHLAVSLHAPDDATRRQIVPAARQYTVQQIMHAARRFEQRTGRPPTIEYCMLADVNDSDAQALLLAQLMQGFRAHVNLIPYNRISTVPNANSYQPSTEERIRLFLEILRNAGVVAHVRRARGDDVHAACGQLRRKSGIATRQSIP